MSSIWNLIFIQPITQALFFLSDTTGNLGLAIIILTIAIQLVLFPLRLPSLRSAEKMKAIKPHLDNLKDKHKDDPQKMLQAQMDLYKEHGVSPFGGILPMLLSFPIIIALYSVLRNAISAQTEGVQFLWLNLTKTDPYYILPIVVVVFQWFLVKISSTANTTGGSGDDMSEMMQKNMQLIFPLMLGLITLRVPSGVGIYFVVSAVFAIIQQVWIRKQLQTSKT
ncbi:membrane protein insertase YidC [candidate division WWE3 bacterium]|uniref:Membrane protein insertase YidC n=1 Tax=candidate division WWE3 bacterium TaxID=2053526 RepID=A0A955RPE0_UNCKA|nr:membrane protein insertase YidC [candidate division WWE3 bacterium]